jgi:hypothetical protein
MRWASDINDEWHTAFVSKLTPTAFVFSQKQDFFTQTAQSAFRS